MAESRFKTLCTDAGYTCNKSIEDDHGWDFFVECPLVPDDTLPADKHPGPRQILVQVKSTANTSPRTRLTVNNALKLTKSALPCFLVLFHWPPVGEERIYASHIWAETMKRALRRGREMAKKKSVANKAEISIGFGESDDHTLDLLGWMVATVKGLEPNYGEKKRQLSESLGYEEGKYRADIKLGPLKGIEDLVDHQLRIKDYLPVSRFNLVDARFGIDAPVPNGEGGRGRLVLKLNNQRPLNVVLRTSGEEAISLSATARYPVVPELPADKFKFVVETWMFRLIISAEGINTLEISDFWSKKVGLKHLVDLSRLISWGGRPVTLKFAAQGLPANTFSGKLNSNGDEALFRELSRFAITLHYVEHEAGTSDEKISLCDMYDSWSDLSFFHHVLTDSSMQVSVDCDLEWKRQNRSIRLVSWVDCKVGERFYFVVFDMPVNDRSAEADQVDFECGRRAFVECFAENESERVLSAGLSSYNLYKANLGFNQLPIDDFKSLFDR